MRNISRLLIIVFTITSLGFTSCEDEDVLRAPDFVVPVVLLAQNVTGNYDWANLNSSTYSFTLDGENFDGAADGHKFFVGRSGTTSTLIDVTLLISFSQSSDIVEFRTFQAAELPAQVSITAAEAASAAGVSVADFDKGDSFQITYLYRIDDNNTGNIRELATPGVDYCGGTTNEGEFCQLVVSVTGDLLDYEVNRVNADTVLRSGVSESIPLDFTEAVTNAPQFALVNSANGGAITTSGSGDVFTVQYVPGGSFTGIDSIRVFDASVVAPTGNMDEVPEDFILISVDNTAPTYELSSVAVDGDNVTVELSLSEVGIAEGLTYSVTSADFEDVTGDVSVSGDKATFTFAPGVATSGLSFTASMTGTDAAGNALVENTINITID